MRCHTPLLAAVALLAFPAASPAAGGPWWHDAAAAIARSEYAASLTAAGLQAPNRAHDLRTTFAEAGITVAPRRPGAAPPWQWRWETRSFGRPGCMQAVEPVAPRARGARVTYERPGLLEWYVNSEEGLEQGFTVREAPGGEGPLRLEGEIGGGLAAEPLAGGRAVDFLDEHGARVLRYGDLAVRDARGRELTARIDAAGGLLALVVDDRGAAYPLAIDPLMTSPAWTAESNQSGA